MAQRGITGLVLFGIAWCLAACAGPSEPEVAQDELAACVWGTTQLLAEAGAGSFERSDCGVFNGSEYARAARGLACLDALPADQGGELVVNRCLDCSILSVYVVTPERERFVIGMEADQYGDEMRVASVERCAAFEAAEMGRVTCSNAESLYACEDMMLR